LHIFGQLLQISHVNLAAQSVDQIAGCTIQSLFGQAAHHDFRQVLVHSQGGCGCGVQMLISRYRTR
jgi:hypothetical protein